MKKIKLLSALLFLAAFPETAISQLIINEFMQSNIDCIMDDLNEFPDSWVELYNPGPDVVDLSEYSLGIKDKYSKAYRLPQESVAAGKHIVIYCDKAEQGRHTDFRLESGKGGAIYLFKGEEIVDQLTDLKKQPAPNISYGRVKEGDEEWGYQAVPTPGRENCGRICKDILGSPVFSVPGCVSKENVLLSLSIPADAPEGTVIRYTTDGTEPTESCEKYEDPFTLTKSTVVRAKLFCEGYLSPRSTTQSYIKHERDVTLPVVSLVTDPKYFFDNKIGIYTYGSYQSGTPNYEYDWRRPINYEYFEDGGSESAINQLCETRVKGGFTRINALKSLAVYANKRFGEKRFNFEFFPDQTPGISEFKSIELRNAGNDFDYLYFRDAVIQQCMGMNCDLDWQPYQPVIFYLNGEYKGIINVRPRSNEDYVYSFYDGLEDIDMLENWEELKAGSFDSFNDFMDIYMEAGHSFEEYEQLMDCEEFCNLMIMEIFFDNKDFPGNNIAMWRPTAEGGKWRWVVKDTDYGMGLYGEPYNYKTLEWIMTPGYDNDHYGWSKPDKATNLFKHLMETPEFKDMWIDRCAVYLGDFLRPEEINKRIDNAYNLIKSEYKYHRNLYNPWWNNQAQEVSNAKTWIRNRVPFFYQHVADYYNLAAPVDLIISDVDERALKINGVELQTGLFDGKYYPGRKLELTPPVSDKAGHWDVSIQDKDGSETTSYPDGILNIEMPTAQKVEVRYMYGEAGVNLVENIGDTDGPAEIFDLSGRFIGYDNTISLPSGVYIKKQGRKVKKIII